MFVAIQIIGAGIIRDKQVGPAIVIVISPYRAESVVVIGIVDSSFLRHFFERSIAAIVKQQI